MTHDPMAGPGGVRRFAARWVVTAELVAETAVHLDAGEEGDSVDMALLRDLVSARPLLTGASLAGALRDHACEWLLGDRAVERRAPEDSLVRYVSRLFGGVREDPEGAQSALVVFDAVAAPMPAELRDGVRIDPCTGTAKERFKYDLEVWPPGTSFPIRLDLQVPEGIRVEEEARLLALLALAMEGIESGDVRVGARGRRGFGRCRLRDARARRFDLQGREGWLAWLRTGLDGEPPVPPDTPADGTLVEALQVAWPAVAGALAAGLEELRRQRTVSRLTVEIPVRFAGGLLVGSPPATATGADVRHLRSGGRPVLSGTALAGALRQRALRIARVVRAQKVDADAWVEELFGSAPPEGGSRRASRLFASRLTVDEVPVEGGHDLQVTRIQVDRFTAAPVEGALVQEEPVYSGRAALRLDLRLPAGSAKNEEADALSGLLLLVVKDLLLGDVPLGGTTGAGRGAVRPGGAIRLTRDEGKWEYVLDVNAAPSDEQREMIDGWVAAFWSRPPLQESRSSAADPAGAGR